MRTTHTGSRIGNILLPALAGVASFLFSLGALLFLTAANYKIGASVGLGVFALLVCWVAAERPNSQSARGNAALVDRLLAVGAGDLISPTPALVHQAMPAVGEAVDRLFAQVRVSIEKAKADACYDPVTGLPNRQYFRQEAEALLLNRDGGTMAALMFVDLDRFKAINDNLGHARGDEALKIVAERLGSVAAGEVRAGRTAPLVARLAGDEFILFFPDAGDAVEAGCIADTALAALARPFVIQGHSFDVGASIGVALCPRDGSDLTTLMRASDIAMYQAKLAGRGQVCIYDERLAREFDARAATASDLKTAVANDEFELYFQPQVTPRTGELVAVEALLRWHHPREGLRLPGTFIPVAEDCGLIIDLGDWVVDAVAETLARWRTRGIAVRLALNVSPRQLDRARFFARLRETMARTGADLGQLELEFTETATMAIDDTVLGEIAGLRADGAHIALDDFGTGYSNLARLKTLPLDRIKIDRSLVRDIATCARSRVIVQAVVQLVHGIGCVAVAEGVESEAQAEVLRLIGCDTFQGFAFARPMPEPALIEWMEARVYEDNMRAISAA